MKYKGIWERKIINFCFRDLFNAQCFVDFLLTVDDIVDLVDPRTTCSRKLLLVEGIGLAVDWKQAVVRVPGFAEWLVVSQVLEMSGNVRTRVDVAERSLETVGGEVPEDLSQLDHGELLVVLVGVCPSQPQISHCPIKVGQTKSL